MLPFRISIFLSHWEKFFKWNNPHSSTIEASLPAIENKHLIIRISYFCELWYWGTRRVSNSYTLGFTQDQNQWRTKSEKGVKEGQIMFENYAWASTSEQKDREHTPPEFHMDTGPIVAGYVLVKIPTAPFFPVSMRPAVANRCELKGHEPFLPNAWKSVLVSTVFSFLLPQNVMFCIGLLHQSCPKMKRE